MSAKLPPNNERAKTEQRSGKSRAKKCMVHKKCAKGFMLNLISDKNLFGDRIARWVFHLLRGFATTFYFNETGCKETEKQGTVLLRKQRNFCVYTSFSPSIRSILKSIGLCIPLYSTRSASKFYGVCRSSFGRLEYVAMKMRFKST